jgi:hypothetical protein
MVKMQSKGNIFVILDNGRIVIFESSYDAWCYIFLLKGIRPKVAMPPKSLYPVRTLDPGEEGGKKNVTFRLHT